MTILPTTETNPFGTARTEAQQDTRAAEAEATAALRRLMEEQSKKIAEQELLIGTLQGRVTTLTAENTALGKALNEERAAHNVTKVQASKTFIWLPGVAQVVKLFDGRVLVYWGRKKPGEGKEWTEEPHLLNVTSSPYIP
jgi:hypothetical protein